MLYKKHGLTEKVVGFGADNASTNFKGLNERKQTNILEAMLQSVLARNSNLGCAAQLYKMP